MSYFHYSNIDGLYGIVSGGKAWFGSLAFMNDDREGYELHEVLKRFLTDRHGETGAAKVLALVEEAVTVLLRHQFVFCASTLQDDLSQWRAYSRLGHGICIEFEDGFIPGDAVSSFPCLYDFEDKVRVVQSSIGLSAGDMEVDEILNSSGGVDRYAAAVIDAMSRFKAESFRGEQETRWLCRISALSDPGSRSVKYRPHRLGLMPYIERPVDLSKVRSVTLGPQVPRENYRSVEDFLISNECAGYVTTSTCNLR